MTDYVLKSPDQASFMAAAERLGYVQRDPDGSNPRLITQGVTLDGGNFFINIIGPVPNEAGFWVRIRANNERPIPATPPGFAIYPPVKYLPDGVTPDPNYTQPPYGMIA